MDYSNKFKGIILFYYDFFYFLYIYLNFYLFSNRITKNPIFMPNLKKQ